ncbi:hypothetical protein EBR04_08425, partial [bacterium]|nr:hypothetical protein [bacterium]
GVESYSYYDESDADQQLLTLVVPAGVSAGQIRVVTAGGSVTLEATSILSLASVAASGTPANAAVASANNGQIVVLSVADPTADDRVVFTAISPYGYGDELAALTVTPESVDAVAGTITVRVPKNATTGVVRLERDSAGVILQIVPVVSELSISGGSYAGNSLTVTGSGFVEGSTSVFFGDRRIDDTGRSSGTDVYGFYGDSRQLSLTVPNDAATGPIRVQTVGGTSAAFAVGFTGITGSAAIGTPTDAALPSANPGGTITLHGTNLTTSTRVLLQVGSSYYSSSSPGLLWATPKAVNEAGTEAIVDVPWDAVTGDVRVLGSADSFPLQIVPVITSVRTESEWGGTATIVLDGFGFVENGTEYAFGPAGSLLTLVDSPDAQIYVSDRYDQSLGEWIPNGTVRLYNVTLVDGLLAAVTAKTAGGTSPTASSEANDPPVAKSPTRTSDGTGTVALAVADLASDVNGDPLTITIGTVFGGTAVLDLSGGILFTPEANFAGGTVAYTVSDGKLAASGTVTIGLATPAAPVANNPSKFADASRSATFTIEELGSSPDDLPLTISIIASPAGTASIDADGGIFFTLDPQYTSGQVVYSVSDGTSTVTGSLTLAVSESNAPPTAVSLQNAVIMLAADV